MNNALEPSGQGNGNQAQGPATTPGPEKLFTQDDVNRIIGERLARVKTEVSPELKEKEQELAQRELCLDARERLADAGLPKELLTALNCNSREEMENSIKTIQGLLKNGESTQQRQRMTYRVSTGISAHDNKSCGLNGGSNDPASIRKAMGLKG